MSTDTRDPSSTSVEARTYRELADALPAIACLTTPAGVCEHVNPRWLEYTQNSEVTDAWAEVVHPDDLERSRQEWSRAIIADRYSVELRLRRADGEYRWFLVHASPLIRHDAQRSPWLLIAADIDEQKQDALKALARAQTAARESERRFQGTLEHAPVGVAHNTPDGRFELVNEAFCNLVGYTEAELLERTWQDITHPDDLNLDESFARRAVDGEIPYYTMEKRYVRKDGAPVWASLFGNFIRDDAGNVVKGVGVAIDITARRLAEQRLEAIVSSIADYLVSFDREWRYTYANETTLLLLGKTREELLGVCVWDVYPEAVEGDLYRDLHAAAREGRVVRAEHYYESWNKWFLSHIYPTAEGVTVYSLDVTDTKHTQRALEESEARFRRALKASPLPLAIHAEDGEMVMINDAWTAITGYELAEIPTVGAWTERAYGERKESVRGVIDRLYDQDATSHEGEFEIRTRNGETRTWDFRSAALGRDSRGRRLILSIATDVTAQRATVAALRESEGQQRALAAALRDADRRKDEFLAMLAHELRNPLAPIQNAMGILELVDVQHPMLEQCRTLIGRQLEHLVRMVDDLLDVSRITRGKIALDRSILSLSSVVREAVESAQPTMSAQGHTLSVDLDDDIQVDADRTRLVQIVVNLLTNAARFTPPSGAISVRTGGSDVSADIVVRDNGVGIAEDAQQRIFELFVQEHVSFDRSRGGLGIGLTVVKRLVELHGGSVRVQSAGMGEGSEFVVSLPRAARVAVHAGSSTLESPGRIRIVIVDDNEDITDSLKMLLELGGHELFLLLFGYCCFIVLLEV
jgi:PAS domain S-box-containing protein